jgi:DNA topoisomerase-1
MDYDFTAEMEEDLDRIARGEKEWHSVIGEFFKPLAKKIEKVEETAERAKVPVETTGEKCPECGEGEVVIRTGKFGKFKSCSRFPECKFTENIVEKLEGQHCPLCTEGDIIIRKSRWGKPFYGCSRYPNCDWASWAKPELGLKISASQWAKMQQERQERIAKRKAKDDESTGKKSKKPAAKKSTKAKKKTVSKKTPAKKAT